MALLLSLLARLAPAQQLAQRHFGTTQGLSHNRVYDLFQDRQGRLWAATRGGICWYEGGTFHPLRAQGRPPGHGGRAFAEQADGTLWLGYDDGLSWLRNGRLHQYRLKGFDKETIYALYFSAAHTLWVGTTAGLYRCQLGTPTHPADTLVTRVVLTPGREQAVSRIGPGPDGGLFAATKGGLFCLDAATGRVVARPDLPAAVQRDAYVDLVQAADTLWWLGTEAHGLLRLSRAAPGRAWRTRRYTEAEGLNADKLLRLLLDRRGRLWLMTTAGACYLDGRDRLHVYPDPTNNSKSPGVLLEDREGNLWLGHGAAGLDQRLADEQFSFFGQAEGLPAGGVMAVHALGQGVYWLGTHTGILRFEPDAPPRQRVRPVPAPAELEGFVRSFARDAAGGIWVGTGHRAARYAPATGQWQSFENVPGLRNQRVLSIAEDRRGRIWLATQDNGLTVFDPGTQAWRTLTAQDADGPGTVDLWKMMRGRDGTLWVATENRGVLRLREGAPGQPDRFVPVPGSAAYPSIADLSEDPAGGLWMVLKRAATLLHYDGRHLSEVPARVYPGNRINLDLATVQADSAGRIWVGTGQGLDCYVPRTGQVRSFGVAEGVLGEGAQETATYLDPTGTLWVGTHQGLMRQQPAGAYPNRLPPLTRLTGLKLFLHDTAATPGLELAHHQNQLTFDYVGVSLTNPEAVRYRYQLQGFDTGWQGPVATPSATYTNLPPGHYTFAVKAANNEGVWNARPATYSFRIRPPWWRTWWAYGLYAGAFGLLLYGVRHSTRTRERQRADRDMERQKIRHLQELDRVKTDFFTNISHEFRTPLTLILGPAEELVTDAPDAVTRQRGSLVLRQARKLLQLINQLLDLSKLEAGALQLQPRAGDAAALARRLVASFESLAESRAVRLRYEAPAAVPLVFDPDKLEDVLTNLVANALRFTPAGGQVTVAVAELPATPAAPAGAVAFTVRDTGPGIAAQDLPHLFERFYQARHPAADTLQTGTGIGLALVRELTALHGGTVAVASEPGAGATFTLWLPRVLHAPAGATAHPAGPAQDHPAKDHPAQDHPVLLSVPAPEAAALPEAEIVLIVEDNAEVRAFIRATLAPAGYRFLEAPDGLAGVALALAEVPDLVLSDVMMPGLDGYQVCARLKTDPATSHIPVVLLTAKSAPDARLEGLETGADSFLAKPFNPRELRAQVRNLLALRQRMQARFAGAPLPVLPLDDGTPGEVPAAGVPGSAADPLATHAAAVAGLPSLDQKFLQRLDETVLRHLENEEFDVDQLVVAMAMSRAQFYRKLKALTGQAPGEYIRITRLHRALALLRAQVSTVAEVTYQVGFSSPTHFSTAFSRQFGYPPSAVARQQAGEAV